MSADSSSVAEYVDGVWQWRADLRVSATPFPADAPARTRVVEIPMAPPRRLMQSLRWRPSKIRYDQDVWAQCMQPVTDLLDAGWRVVRVHVEWGKNAPNLPAERERVARELTRCDVDCDLVQTQTQPGKGETMVTLEQEERWMND